MAAAGAGDQSQSYCRVHRTVLSQPGNGQEAVLAVFPGLWHDENYRDIYFQVVFYRIKTAGIAGMIRTGRNHGNLKQRNNPRMSELAGITGI